MIKCKKCKFWREGHVVGSNWGTCRKGSSSGDMPDDSNTLAHAVSGENYSYLYTRPDFACNMAEKKKCL